MADEHVIELFEEVVVVDEELAARLVVETYEVFELLAEGSPAGVPTSERVENGGGGLSMIRRWCYEKRGIF